VSRSSPPTKGKSIPDPHPPEPGESDDNDLMRAVNQFRRPTPIPVQDEAHQLVHGGAPQVEIPQEEEAGGLLARVREMSRQSIGRPVDMELESEIQTRIALEREFVAKAEALLTKQGIHIDDPEDVRRVCSFFYSDWDLWDLSEFKRNLYDFSRPAAQSRIRTVFLDTFTRFPYD
jgi:hypothetical protein